MVEVAVPTRVHIRPLLSVSPHLPIRRNIVSTNTKACKIRGVAASSSSSSSSSSSTSTCGYKQPVDDGQIVLPNKASKKRVFFLDVNPLCYAGSSPSLHAFAHWVSLFLNQVSLSDPVITVVDGEGGSEHRRQLLPSYKAHRWKFIRQFSRGHVGRSHGVITNVLRKCNVPVRCNVGDHADGVPGSQHLAPGFGQKTALKLLKKHGSLENLLNTAAVRTVGRQYAQDALTKHADYLRRNHEILSLRRDVDVKLREG